MSDEIKPALTPEEWAYVATHGGGRPETAAWVERHVGDLSVIQFRDGSLRVHQQADQYGTDVTTPQRRALAALALHGQPFGFTHDHLRALQNVLASIGDRGPGQWVLPEVIARIAALLPPE